MGPTHPRWTDTHTSENITFPKTSLEGGNEKKSNRECPILPFCCSGGLSIKNMKIYESIFIPQQMAKCEWPIMGTYEMECLTGDEFFKCLTSAINF